jgi:predicted RNA-binding Zn-ribbon protein involved in translation (DUF1610 family)
MLILPVIRFRRFAVSGRQHRNACSSCGYNLTGNTSGVCPECGSKIE